MRRQPVAFALVDAAFLADSKWRALRRRLSDPRDFQSAVGAWLIVLTAARRNGLPDLDINEEAEDVTFIPDLIAVGLLTEAGVPEKAFRGWAPRRPSYPSDLAPSAPNVPNATNTPADKPSTPFLSTQLPEEQDAREDFDALDVYHSLTGYRPWGAWSGDELKALVNDYTDPTVQEAIRVEWNANHDRKGILRAVQARLARDLERSKEATRTERKARPRIVVDPAVLAHELGEDIA